MTILSSAKDANELHVKLVEGVDFSPPTVDWNNPIFDVSGIINDPNFSKPISLTNEDLTTRRFGGSGAFDALQESVYNHLREEFDKGRITGNEYTKAYMALTEASLGNAVQFLINRDQSYWQALASKIDAHNSLVNLEIAKAELALRTYSAANEAAKFANTKMNTLNLEVGYKTATFNLEKILDTNHKTALFSLEKILPAQHILVKEQGEVQRAQTLDTRSDHVTVVGVVGKQKDLYSQQIESYKRDSEYKIAKFYVDAFTVMKTIDEGLVAPTEFTSANITTVLQSAKRKVDL